jgi:cellulose synthase/poly-beta-1,6-N-acetylglucosamine synthase-like glycosyltransferase
MTISTSLFPNGHPAVEENLASAQRIARLLSEPVCRSFGLLPLSYSGGVLSVAVSDLEDTLAANVARKLLGHEIELHQWPIGDIERALDVVFETSGDTLEPESSQASPPDTSTRPGSLPTDPPRRIGELFLELELITEEQLTDALTEQHRTGSRLGEILVASGAVSEQELLAVIADHFNLQRVNLSGYKPEAEVTALIPEPLARGLRCVPLAADESTLYLAVADALEDETIAMLAEHTHLELKELLATRNSIDDLVRDIYGKQYVHTAKQALRESDPDNSADRVLSTAQRYFFIGATVAIALLLVLFTQATLIALVACASAFYLASSLYKARLIYRSLGGGAYIDVTDEEIAALDERDLPVYTILVPLYNEAAIVPRLMAGIGRLNYPKTKLDVRLLCEEDDPETPAAIRALAPPPHFKLVVVPDSQPKTKPKACNYGILQADGKYVVIFDAEDKPEPDQLKRAVVAFRKAEPSLTCLQAKLNYFNPGQNLLTRWFSMEYSMHFDLLLPGLCAVKAPIPLGGTSNHFRTDRLIELGAWDPYNVTEDADLGIRLFKAGYTTSMIDSTTLEEANSDVGNWIRQRSRWIKGYFQTWLVHMRHPVRLCRQIGLRAFTSFNLIVGGAFIFLLNPIFWALTIVFAVTQAGFIQVLFPPFIFYIAAGTLFLGNFMFVFFNVAGTLQQGNFDLTRYALLSPVYWAMMSWAAWKGFIQLIYKPFYWEKTVHGLDEGEEH